MTEPEPLVYCSFATEAEALGVLVVSRAECDAWLKHEAPLSGLVPLPVCELAQVDIPPEQAETYALHRNRFILPAEAQQLFGARPIKEWEKHE